MKHVFSNIPDLAFPAMSMMMLHEAEEHGLPVLSQSDCDLTVGSEYGEFGIEARDKGVTLHIRSETDDKLHIIRESLVEHLLHHLPHLKDSLRWSDNLKGKKHPPNFQFAEILEAKRLSADFQRLTLKPENIGLFDDKAMHFRFALPKPGLADPVWPETDATGATNWPTGDYTLHRPAYTVRYLDPYERTLTVDVFVHDGGRVCTWAQAAQPGERVALTGPGGGGVLTSDHVILGGDETAFPAIARILDALPQAAQGWCFVYSQSGEQDYPFSVPPGVELTWLASEDALLKEVSQAISDQPDAYLWLAAEKSVIRQFRATDTFKTGDKNTRYVAQYWSRDGGDTS